MNYTDLLPALAGEEYEALKADIAERGCLLARLALVAALYPVRLALYELDGRRPL